MKLITELTDAERSFVEQAADLAIDSGNLVAVPQLGFVLASDLLILAGLANGMPTPNTWTLQRADGRSASVYGLPEALR